MDNACRTVPYLTHCPTTAPADDADAVGQIYLSLPKPIRMGANHRAWKQARVSESQSGFIASHNSREVQSATSSLLALLCQWHMPIRQH